MWNFIAILTKVVPFHAADDEAAIDVLDEMEAKVQKDGVSVNIYKMPVHNPNQGDLDFGDTLH